VQSNIFFFFFLLLFLFFYLSITIHLDLAKCMHWETAAREAKYFSHCWAKNGIRQRDHRKAKQRDGHLFRFNFPSSLLPSKSYLFQVPETARKTDT
jgi:hypothetical protein